ncbi:MAG: 6,7-dimethyl-8-ribityllumazine synthase [Phycisphaerales bacterium]|nr:6,7-dimethyl-8-ribityllumazine synthase [Phycisphaerales bacterium]
MRAESVVNGVPPSLPRVAVIVSRYNPSVTDRLCRGALAEYENRGGHSRDAEVFHAPGAFELPVLAMEAARAGRFGAVVVLGCIVRGQTRHDRYIAQAVADGVTRVGLDTGVACGFGVLTVNNADQAHARAGGKKGNKGAEAMAAALDTAAALAAVRNGLPSPVVAVGAPDKAGRG